MELFSGENKCASLRGSAGTHTPMILPLRGLHWEDLKFKASLGYATSSEVHSGGLVSKTQGLGV